MTDPVMLLSQLHGEGRVTFRAVRAAGFYTLASIAEAPVQTLADRAHLSSRTARRLKTGAEEMIGKGIGLDAPDPDAAGRQGRKLRQARWKTGFSEGVLLEEAALLGQGEPPQPQPAIEPGAVDSPVQTDAMTPGSIDVGRRIAAAAAVAAGLSRHPAPRAVATATATAPANEGEQQAGTFWGFG